MSAPRKLDLVVRFGAFAGFMRTGRAAVCTLLGALAGALAAAPPAAGVGASAAIRTERGCTEAGATPAFAPGEPLRGTLRVDVTGAEEVAIRLLDHGPQGTVAPLFSGIVSTNRELPFATTVPDLPGHHVLVLEAEAGGVPVRAECGYAVNPAPTTTPAPPAPSPTPTPPATAGASPTPPTATFAIAGMEVVQSVQTASGAVPLVAGKRTFVRVYPRAAGRTGAVRARLTVGGAAGARTITPLLPGEAMRPATAPRRQQLVDGFLFELPSEATFGTVTVEATLEEEGAGTVPVRAQRTIDFVELGRPEVVLYEIVADAGGERIRPRETEVRAVERWVASAWPAAGLRLRRRRLRPQAGEMTCEDINAWLAFGRGLDRAWGELAREERQADRYLALVPDPGGFVRGCSPLGGATAVAPAGGPARRFPPDPDDTYADWYAAHELSHAYGLPHADPASGRPFAWQDARISPQGEGPAARIGFDGSSLRVLAPGTPDLTSRFPDPWISDLAWAELLRRLAAGAPVTGFPQGRDPEENGLWLVATAIAPAAGGTGVRVLPLAPVPGTVDGEEDAAGGDWSVALRNAEGTVTAEVPFLARSLLYGPVPQGEEAFDREGWLLTAVLPPVGDAVRLEVRRGTTAVASRSAGPAPPAIAIREPEPGAPAAQDELRVAWSATDPDGDAVACWVQYSGDGGATWRWVAGPVTSPSLRLDTRDLPASHEGRLRVWASDGLHASFAEVAVTVPERPPLLDVLEPDAGSTFASRSTVHLGAWAEDPDDGWLRDDTVRWESDRDGFLGLGRSLTVTGLTPGRHRITVSTRDSGGNEVSREVEITVVAGGGAVPPPPKLLSPAPSRVVLDTGIGVRSAGIDVAAMDAASELSWAARVDVPWLAVGPSAGTTPGFTRVALQRPFPERGRHFARVLLTSRDAPGRGWVVGVEAIIRPPACEADCDGSGRVTVADLVLAVRVALGEEDPAACPAADTDGDGRIAIGELIRAVGVALRGCAAADAAAG